MQCIELLYAFRFKDKKDCMVEQYNEYTFPHLNNLNVNGIGTLDENISDNGGVKAAYKAYSESNSQQYRDYQVDKWSQLAESWVDSQGQDQEKPLPNLPYTPAQMFWISYGNVWCQKWTDAGLRQEVATAVHSPGRFRVLVRVKKHVHLKIRIGITTIDRSFLGIYYSKMIWLDSLVHFSWR